MGDGNKDILKGNFKIPLHIAFFMQKATCMRAQKEKKGNKETIYSLFIWGFP